MSNYVKTVDFAAKDALLTGNPAKAGKGTEVDTEFNNIATAIATKLDTSSYTAADVLAKLVTVDGAGSGLDADLLDGQSSLYYQRNITGKTGVVKTLQSGGSASGGADGDILYIY